MGLYTVVHDDYSVQVFRSRKALADQMAREGVRLDPDDEEDVTASEIARAIRLNPSEVNLYQDGQGDWTWKVQYHGQSTARRARYRA